MFTDTYVRNALNNEYFPNQFKIIPRDGDKVNAGEQKLLWHALDSTSFNVKLFRFAYGLNLTTYGAIFWAVTVSTPTLARFDPKSKKGRWTFRKP